LIVTGPVRGGRLVAPRLRVPPSLPARTSLRCSPANSTHASHALAPLAHTLAHFARRGVAHFGRVGRSQPGRCHALRPRGCPATIRERCGYGSSARHAAAVPALRHRPAASTRGRHRHHRASCSPALFLQPPPISCRTLAFAMLMLLGPIPEYTRSHTRRTQCKIMGTHNSHRRTDTAHTRLEPLTALTSPHHSQHAHIERPNRERRTGKGSRKRARPPVVPPLTTYRPSYDCDRRPRLARSSRAFRRATSLPPTAIRSGRRWGGGRLRSGPRAACQSRKPWRPLCRRGTCRA